MWSGPYASGAIVVSAHGLDHAISSAYQNTTVVLIIMLLVVRANTGLPVARDTSPTAVKQRTRVLPCCSVDSETQC